MISNELSKPYTTRTRETMDNFEKGYEEIFTKKKWYNVYNFSIINKMIKKVLGKFVLYSKEFLFPVISRYAIMKAKK